MPGLDSCDDMAVVQIEGGENRQRAVPPAFVITRELGRGPRQGWQIRPVSSMAWTAGFFVNRHGHDRWPLAEIGRRRAVLQAHSAQNVSDQNTTDNLGGDGIVACLPRFSVGSQTTARTGF